MLTTGIDTTAAETMEHGSYLSKLGNDVQVRCVTNPTVHPLWDIVRFVYSNRLNIESPVTKELQTQWYNYFESNPDGRIRMFAHSEGVNNVKEALMSFDRKLAQQIDVICVAPSTCVPSYLCGSVKHLICNIDPVPWNNAVEFWLNDDGTVTRLYAHSDYNLGIFDIAYHSFQHPVYAESLKTEINQ